MFIVGMLVLIPFLGHTVYGLQKAADEDVTQALNATTTATVEELLFIRTDDIALDASSYYDVSFHSEGGEILLMLCADGKIYWRDRLVVTDEELVSALRDVIMEYKCPECGKRFR